MYYRKHDGYSQNTLLDERLDDQDSYAVRGSLLFQPTDALDIHVVADFSHNESHGQSRRAVDDPSVPGLGAVVGVRACSATTCARAMRRGRSGKIKTLPGSRRASTIDSVAATR